MSLHRLRNIRSNKKPMKNERKRQRTITGMRKDEVPKWDNIVNKISRRTVSVHKFCIPGFRDLQKNEGCRKSRLP